MKWYNDAVGFLFKTNSIKSGAALITLERYVNGAILQWNRIQEAKKALPVPGTGVDKKLIQTLFLDIHFYFICADKIQNLIKDLAYQDTQLEQLWKKHEKSFKTFNDCRNHLEHIETRLKGNFLRDFGNLRGDNFTFGGEEFDISSSSLKLLTDAYEEIIRIFQSRL